MSGMAMSTGTLGALRGAIVGSFLATVLVRWPAGESALAGRSRCDGCRRTLAPFELVPVLSFALNRGRCRRCAAPIDRPHLRVEIAAATIAGTAFALVSPAAAFGWRSAERRVGKECVSTVRARWWREH